MFRSELYRELYRVSGGIGRVKLIGVLLITAILIFPASASNCQNVTSDYTLNANVTSTCFVLFPDVVFDGRGYKISGNGSGVAITINGNATVLNTTLENWDKGIVIENSANVTLIQLNVTQSNVAIDASNSSILLNSSKIAGNVRGLVLNNSTGLIYNNYFNNSNNVEIKQSAFVWNTSREFGVNIVEGPFLGGNFWATPDGAGFSQTCPDSDKDGLCDNPYIIDSNNTDFIPLTLWSPSPQPEIIINEIYYNASSWNEEFVELFVWDAGGESDINLSGYRITTFDGESFTLPDVSGLDSYDIIAVYFGSGVSDLDASDGNATIYLGLTYSPLDSGDEIGLYAPDFTLLDFVRFAGGNGDRAMAGWKDSDAGKSQKSSGESIQIFGADLDSSENWLSSLPTPANPNIYFTAIGNGGKTIPLYLENGRIQDYTITQIEIDDGDVLLINYTFIKGSGANLTELNIVRDMLNSTYTFFNNSGMNDPATRSDGSILIRLTKNNRFNAAANAKGVINLDIGGNLKNKNISAFLHWNIAHEFFHLLEYQKINLDGTSNPSGEYRRFPIFFKETEKYVFLADGGAEYWGLDSAMNTYGFTEQQMFDASVNARNQYPTTFRSIDYNYSKIFRTLGVYLISLGTGTSNVYYHGFLFFKYIVSEFNESVAKDIHLKSRDYIGGTTPNELKGRKLLENVTGKTLEKLWSGYEIWIYDNYRNKFPGNIWVFNGNLSNKTTFSSSINPWGAELAGINLNVPDNSTVRINFNQTSSIKDDFNITAVLINGSTQKLLSWDVNNSNLTVAFDSDYQRVELIITRFRDISSTSSLNYSITAGYSRFEFSNLTINKNEIVEGESVTVSADVRNTGSFTGTEAVGFRVDGNVRQTKNITLNPGQTVRVNFTETFSAAGNYSLTIGDHPPTTLTVVGVIAPPPGLSPGNYIQINQSGVYKLYSNLTGYGLRVNASNVIIDGQGYTINTAGYGFVTSFGTVWAEIGPQYSYNPSDFKGVENIVIRNLNIEGGNIKGNISGSRFENLSVNVGNLYFSGAYGLELVRDSVVKNSRFSGGYAGIELSGDGNIIDGVEFSGNGRDVVIFYSNMVKSNVIQNSKFNSSPVGISIQGTDAVIQNNTFADERSSILVYGLSGSGGVVDSNIVIRNNTIIGGAIEIYGANNTIENNIIKDSQLIGLKIGGNYGINNRIINNTISNHLLYGIVVNGGQGNYFAGNNISYNSYYTVSHAFGFPVYGSYSAVLIKNASSTIFDENTFYSNYDTDIMFTGSTDPADFNRDVVIRNSITSNNTRILSFDPVDGGFDVYFWNIINTTIENHRIDSNTTISLTSFRNISVNAVETRPSDPYDYQNIGKYAEFKRIAYPGNTSRLMDFGPATIAFHYNESELMGYSEFALSILAYNSTTGLWVPMTTTIDTTTNIARTNITSPGIYALMIKKNATMPQISVSKTLMDFGNVTVGSNVSRTLDISNSGNGDLIISSISLTGDADFSISLSAPLLLSPGTSVSATVTFSPTSAGVKNATLTIASNDPANAYVNVNIRGYGEKYLPDLYPGNMTLFPSTPKVNETVIVNAWIYNSGNTSLTENVSVSLTVLYPSSSTVTLWKSISMNGLPSQIVKFEFTAMEEGNASLMLIVDPENNFTESDENNNRNVREMLVIPNETVKPQIILIYPNPVDAGESAEIVITIVDEHPDRYQVKRNGTLVSSGSYVNGTPFSIPVYTSRPGSYLYEVIASDRAGNTNNTSFTIDVVDAVSPEIVLLSPPSNAVLYKSDVTLSFSLSDDFSTLLGYEVLVDGVVVKSASGYGNIAVDVKLGNGSHTWGVRASDDYGNSEASFANLTVLIRVGYPSQPIPSIGGDDVYRFMVNNTGEVENETAITGVELAIKARDNTTPVNISVEAFIEPPAWANTTNDTLTGFYLNVTSDDVDWYSNISHITVRVYYNYTLLKGMLSAKGIDESDLRLLRYTNGEWVKLEGGKTLSDGTVVFSAGVVTHSTSSTPSVWANVSKLSLYGLGFEIPPASAPPPSQPPQPSASGGFYISQPTPAETAQITPEVTPTPAPTVTQTPVETPEPAVQKTPKVTPKVEREEEVKPEKTPVSAPEMGEAKTGGAGIMTAALIIAVTVIAAGIYMWRKR